MLTAEQEKWIAHLSDEKRISIFPLDPSAEEKFQAIKDKIQSVFGKNFPVEHHGATKLGISGQDEIDVYIPMPVSLFSLYVDNLTEIFGEPGSLYPLERARFAAEVDGKHIDVFLINEESDGWKNSLIFEEYLLTHPESLEEYRVLKENGNGLSVREYYQKKIEFINEILDKASKE